MRIEKIKEIYKGVQFVEYIVPNGVVEIPSIFMFNENNNGDLFLFRKACKEANCTIVFKNENLTISPDEDDTIKNLKVVIYHAMAECPKFGNDYVQYVNNINKMKMDI